MFVSLFRLRCPSACIALAAAALLACPSAFAEPPAPSTAMPPALDAAHGASVDVSFMSKHPPKYPERELESGVDGMVLLLVLVDPVGHAAAISIEYSSGNKNLDAAAVEAARRWEFHPQVNNGKATASLARVPVEFRLQHGRDLQPRMDLPGGSENFPDNDRAAIGAIQQQAQAGDAESEVTLGLVYRPGLGVTRDPAMAVQWIRKAADQGMVIAYPELAECYQLGIGVPQDYAKAIEWETRFAQGGDAYAEAYIGHLYALMSPPQPDKSRTWYEKSAAHANPALLIAIAAAYGTGDGVPADGARATALLERSAQTGDDTNRLQVSGLLLSGRYVPQDLPKAKALVEQVAAHDDPGAQYELGQMYQSGSGTAVDSHAAFDWFRKSAAQGYGPAQETLSQIYQEGTGVAADLVLAYAWLSLVHDETGEVEIKLFKMHFGMKRSEMKEAMALAKAWTHGQVLERNAVDRQP